MAERQGTSAARQTRSGATSTWHTYRAFGLTWKSEILWPGVLASPGDLAEDVLMQLVDDVEIDCRWSRDADGRDWLLGIDGGLLVVKRGADGDFRMSHAGRLFHVSADGRSVACAAAGSSDPWCLRLLLDTVLWSTALVRGVEALHAAGVEGARGVIGLLAPSGGGKTTLALEFLRRGYRLFCDDVLVLRRGDGAVTAYPSPPMLNVPISIASDRDLPIDPIARLGDEMWCVATRPSSRPAPLAHLVLLKRAPGSAVDLVPAESSLFELRRSCLAHGLIPGRERARFDICADLASRVPVSYLRADLDTKPSELADLIEAAVEQAGAGS